MSEGSREKPADFYLIPVDITQLYGNDTLLAEKALSASQLRDICQKIEARKQLLIIDACQSGAAIGSRCAGPVATGGGPLSACDR